MTLNAWQFPALARLRLLRPAPNYSPKYEPKHAIPPPVYEVLRWSGVQWVALEDTPITLPPCPQIYGGASVTYRAGRLWIGGVPMEARRA